VSSRETGRLLAAALLVGGLLLGVYVYRLRIAPNPPLSADEAGHALPAARMAFALREGSLRGFLDATRREVVWPFVHPWVMTLFLLAFGVSATAARSVSLATFGAALLLIPVLARALARGPDGEPGPHRDSQLPMLGSLTVAVLITATAWDRVCTVMSESLGMFLTLATLIVEARAGRRHRLAGSALGGLLVAAVFFTKYSYGLPLIAAVLFARAWRAREDGLAPLVGALAGIFVPIAVWLAWILGPDPLRTGEILAAFVNRDEGLRGLADLSFYPRAITSAVGIPAALITLGLWAALLTRGLGRRLSSVVFVGVTVVMLTVHPNKQVRYLFPALPVILLLAESELAVRLRRLRGREVLWLATAVIVLVARNPLAEIRETAASAARLAGARPILGYIEANVAARQPVLFLGTTGLLPHLALTWELLEREQREPSVDLLSFPRGGDTYRTGYPAEDGPQYGVALQHALDSGRFRSVVTLELGPRSPFLPDWLAKWDAFGQNYVRAMARPEAQVDYALASERAFPESDATVRIFVRRDPGAPGTDLARSADPSD
jgi:hypothetical protein